MPASNPACGERRVSPRVGIAERFARCLEPWFVAVAIANLVMGTSSVLIPLFLARVLGESVSALGVLSSLVSLAAVVGSLTWGRLSDVAHRRKPFVILSYLVACSCFVGFLWAGSFSSVLLLNVALNFFWIANSSVTVLIVIENRSESLWEGKISALNQFGALGWLFGLILGSVGLALLRADLTEPAAIHAMFGVLAVGAALAGGMALWLVPRTRARFVLRGFRGLRIAVGNFLVETARFNPLHLYHRFNLRNLPALLWGTDGLRPATKGF